MQDPPQRDLANPFESSAVQAGSGNDFRTSNPISHSLRWWSLIASLGPWMIFILVLVLYLAGVPEPPTFVAVMVMVAYVASAMLGATLGAVSLWGRFSVVGLIGFVLGSAELCFLVWNIAVAVERGYM